MNAILGFFQEIAEGIRDFFAGIKEMLAFVKTVKDIFSSIGDTISMASKVLPPVLWAAIGVIVAIVVVIAIMKYAGFGGDVDE